jgi:flagellar assembly factor FliW
MAETKLEKEMIDNEEKLIYQSAYGEIELQEDKLISFSDGIVGFSNCTVFGLAAHPAAKNSPILILQCVNDPSVNFAVVDSSSLKFEYSEEDKKEALKSSGFASNDAIMMFILRTNENSLGEKVITANVKAPIVLDATNKVAKQVILNNKELSTQQEI